MVSSADVARPCGFLCWLQALWAIAGNGYSYRGFAWRCSMYYCHYSCHILRSAKLSIVIYSDCSPFTEAL